MKRTNSQINEAAMDALDLLEQLVEEFPGLLDDTEEINGADLVDILATMLRTSPNLMRHLEA